MKKIILLIFAFTYIQFFTQNKIELSYASQHEDFIEINLKMDKPSSKFDLIDFDTLTVTDNTKKVFKENKEYPLNYNYNNGNNGVRRYYVPDYQFKTIDIKGVMNYFTPSKDNNSYFDLGSVKNIKRNSNLVDKKLTEKNPDLYFSIVDPSVINKIFPGFSYKERYDKEYKKINFKSYDLIYAYRYNDKQKLMYFINDNPNPGYDNLSLNDEKTGIIYKLVKLKRGMTPAEINKIRIELMIENENSIERIPFELKNIIVEK